MGAKSSDQEDHSHRLQLGAAEENRKLYPGLPRRPAHVLWHLQWGCTAGVCGIHAGRHERLHLCLPQVNTDTHLIRHFGPSKEKLSRGVSALQLLPSGNLLVGTGDGVLAVLNAAPSFKKVRSSSRVAGAITSVAFQGTGNKVVPPHSQGWD